MLQDREQFDTVPLALVGGGGKLGLREQFTGHLRIVPLGAKMVQRTAPSAAVAEPDRLKLTLLVVHAEDFNLGLLREKKPAADHGFA
jgi:hypothetical protein